LDAGWDRRPTEIKATLKARQERQFKHQRRWNHLWLPVRPKLGIPPCPAAARHPPATPQGPGLPCDGSERDEIRTRAATGPRRWSFRADTTSSTSHLDVNLAVAIAFLPRPNFRRFNDRLTKARRKPGPSSRRNPNAAAGDQWKMPPTPTCTRQMQTPPDETAGGCQRVRNCPSTCGAPASVDRLEDLARFGVITCELVKPDVGFGQLVDLKPEGEMRQG
jgi:hypothetical protein